MFGKSRTLAYNNHCHQTTTSLIVFLLWYSSFILEVSKHCRSCWKSWGLRLLCKDCLLIPAWLTCSRDAPDTLLQLQPPLLRAMTATKYPALATTRQSIDVSHTKMTLDAWVDVQSSSATQVLYDHHLLSNYSMNDISNISSWQVMKKNDALTFFTMFNVQRRWVCELESQFVHPSLQPKL